VHGVRVDLTLDVAADLRDLVRSAQLADVRHCP
jgi:hypothetical protein